MVRAGSLVRVGVRTVAAGFDTECTGSFILKV
jgi:hypothetical protein